jgi:hypothetical protein
MMLDQLPRQMAVADCGMGWRRVWVLTWCIAAHAMLGPSLRADGVEPDLDQKFWRALATPKSFIWNEQSIRSGLQRIIEGTPVQIWLDRRIDPDHPVTIEVSGEPLAKALQRIAAELGAEAIPIGSLVLIAPEHAAGPLATRALQALRDPQVPSQARRRITAQLDLLTTPREAVQDVASTASIPIDVSSLPHDLLPAVELRDVPAAVLLELFAGGFDLTTDWSSNPVTFRPLQPEDQTRLVTIEYTSSRNAEPLVRQFRSDAPQADARQRGTTVTIRGTAGDHARWAMLATTGVQKADQPATSSGPLDPRARLTLRVANKPLRTVLESITKSMNLELDTSGCQAERLNELISFEAQERTLDELLEEISAKSQASIERQGRRLMVRDDP